MRSCAGCSSAGLSTGSDPMEATGAVLLLPMLDMALSLYSSGTAFSETDIGAYTRFSS